MIKRQSRAHSKELAALSCSLLALLCALQLKADASDLYVSPGGSGSACSSSSPCTVAQAVTLVSPGDHIKLINGVYTGDSGMLSCKGRSGTASQRIYFEAIQDGAVLIDGQDSRNPAALIDCSYWTVQGVN